MIGTIALAGLVRVIARGRRAAGFGGAWGGDGRRGSRGPVRALFSRLDTTPGQERVILEAIDEARGSVRASRGELKATRKDVLDAVRADHFDPILLEGTFERHDERIAAMRGAFTGALARVHEALDDKQRVRLAEIIRSGLLAGPRVPGGAVPEATGGQAASAVH
ncbi:MAG: periplasmic heavy metal sensor [Deltaproteobacteria bacterium]